MQKYDYEIGFRIGFALGMIFMGILFAVYAHIENQRLLDEVKATNYYYSLTKN